MNNLSRNPLLPIGHFRVICMIKNFVTLALKLRFGQLGNGLLGFVYCVIDTMNGDVKCNIAPQSKAIRRASNLGELLQS